MTGFIKELKKAYSRSYHYTQLGNALQKHFFASSALIMGTLKRSTNRFFNFSVQSQNFTGVRMDSIYPNLPIRSKINVNEKS